MVTFLRIFAHVTAFPALLFFFYIVIKGLGSSGSTAGRVLTYIGALFVFVVPVFFNRLAKYIDERRKSEPL